MIIVGIAGTNASGKDTMSELLVKEYGFLFISVGDMLRETLRATGLPETREYARELSLQWRRSKGLGIIVDKAVDIFKSKSEAYKGLVVASLRHPAEVERVHELGGKVIWMDADPKIRFERIKFESSVARKDRSADDNKSYSQFLSDEQIEMHPIVDEASIDGAGVKAMADIFFENNYSELKDFQLNARKIIIKLLNA